MKTITIGRSSDNDIIINAATVSRHHAKITEISTGVYEIEDLNSKNGTYVNGRKVKGRMSLKPTDRIVLSSTKVTDWLKALESKPSVDNTPEVTPHTPAPEQSAPPTGVLYDFSKNVEISFREFSDAITSYIKETESIHTQPIRQRIPRKYSEDLFDIAYEQYISNGNQMVVFLKYVEQRCMAFKAQYDADMKKLDNTFQYRLLHSNTASAPLDEVEDHRNAYRTMFDKLKKQLLDTLENVIANFYSQNPERYPERYELSPADSDVWENIKNRQEQIQNTFYIGTDHLHFDILGDTMELKLRSYVRLMCGGNVLMNYNTRCRKKCFDTANTLISRALIAAPNAGLQVHMVDFNELEGTCSLFKDLSHKVYNIVSRYDDYSQLLNLLYGRVENVVQNLLKGDIRTLTDYNTTKTNKEPIHLLVLKDVPIGYRNETWLKLAEIMRNGPRAGVSVLILADQDTANSSEDMLKVYRNMMHYTKNMIADQVDFITHELPHVYKSIAHTVSYDHLTNSTISKVVKHINQTMEVKPETVLRYSDYMLPEKDWWKRQSANRIDVPFGISTDMQTQALHITQESGQNSAVVIGIPGSGKSVFLHALIANAAIHYSPKELQMYLLDFSGVEFNTYAQHELPHARVVAPEAEREFGLSILRELKSEGDRRMALCRDHDVTNIVELKEKNPDMVVPRLLVIIDEFQKLFEIDTDKISQEANRYIHVIIQEYRKFGINLILATQKLPSKSILPRELIANRIVFKSDPNDFSELVKWPSQTPRPLLQTGVCIYNDESGAEYSNNITRGFFIKASTELNDLLDRISAFAKSNIELIDTNLTIRVFRSNDLPDFNKKTMAEKHFTLSSLPKEVGVYVGESIAITETDVYVPLVKESNNNILIIGGRQDVAKKIAYYTLLSQSIAHDEGSSTFVLCNFMRNDDELQTLYNSEQIEAIKQSSQWFDARKADEVSTVLGNLKGLIDYRKNLDDEAEMQHVYLHITSFQLGRMFDMGGSSGDRPSDCSKLLETILKDGPSLGIFTVLQVDNLNNLNRLGRGALNLFNHRIALQMPENDSNKVVGTTAANKLKVSSRPSSDFRALYFNFINNEITKFKPYK